MRPSSANPLVAPMIDRTPFTTEEFSLSVASLTCSLASVTTCAPFRMLAWILSWTEPSLAKYPSRSSAISAYAADAASTRSMYSAFRSAVCFFITSTGSFGTDSF